MLTAVRTKYRRHRERLRFRFLPTVVDWMTCVSTLPAWPALKQQQMRVLVDNTVVAHSVIHETKWVSTGTKEWGGQEISTGYAARVPVHSHDSDSRVYDSVLFLPGIVHLTKTGRISLFTSAELIEERDRQPIGLYRGYSYYDYSLMAGIQFPSIDGHLTISRSSSYLASFNQAAEQRGRLQSSDDELFRAIVARLGTSNSQDAWHIRTAEIHGLFCFLTMDFKLARTVQSMSHLEPFRSLRTRIMTPAEFGRYLKLAPVSPHLFAYHQASFPVQTEFSMPGSQRRSRRDYAKAR
jgi:hypothetical protein